MTVDRAVQDGVATLTIRRPDALNALNADVLDAIGQAAHELRGHANGIIITGEGKAFVAGADIAQMQSFGPVEAEAFSRRGQAAFQALATFPGPVVAAVNGYALGGGLELALACDFIIASERAVLGQPEVALGVVPGFGGTQRLPRRIGPAQAKLLLMTGAKMTAPEALRIGLVDKVVAPEALMAEAKAIVTSCIANGPLAVAAAKRLVDDGDGLGLATGLGLEAQAFGQLFATADQKEGMQAFLGKRKAAFKGI